MRNTQGVPDYGMRNGRKGGGGRGSMTWGRTTGTAPGRRAEQHPGAPPTRRVRSSPLQVRWGEVGSGRERTGPTSQRNA